MILVVIFLHYPLASENACSLRPYLKASLTVLSADPLGELILLGAEFWLVGAVEVGDTPSNAPHFDKFPKMEGA